MNHSDSPNGKLKLFELEFESETASSIFIIPKITMMKNIKKDEELTTPSDRIAVEKAEPDRITKAERRQPSRSAKNLDVPPIVVSDLGSSDETFLDSDDFDPKVVWSGDDNGNAEQMREQITAIAAEVQEAVRNTYIQVALQKMVDFSSSMTALYASSNSSAARAPSSSSNSSAAQRS